MRDPVNYSWAKYIHSYSTRHFLKLFKQQGEAPIHFNASNALDSSKLAVSFSGICKNIEMDALAIYFYIGNTPLIIFEVCEEVQVYNTDTGRRFLFRFSNWEVWLFF